MAEEFTAKFKVDISDLKKNISEANKEIKLANATFKAETAGMDKWSDNADGLSKKLEQLKSVLNSQKSIMSSYQSQLERQQAAYEENGRRAEQLKAKLQELAQNGVSKTDEEYQKYEKALKNVVKEQQNNQQAVDQLQLAVLNEKAAIGQTEKEIKKYEQAEASLGEESQDTSKDIGQLADQTEKATKEAKEGSEGYTVFKGVLADLASTAIKAAVSGLKDLGAAFVDLTKQAISGYAEMEQLQGGVEKLFGEDSAAVIKNASDAWKTAGMDMNSYMETVTGFSASLISSLGGDTEKAAQMADMAIQDMSDNANTFGTDMASVQARTWLLSRQFTRLWRAGSSRHLII